MSSPQDAPRLAVLIGIDKYVNGIPPLRGAVDDVQAVGDVLHELRRLVNKQATADGIRKLLAALQTEVAQDHRVVFYFAGHGIAEAFADNHRAENPHGPGPQGLLLPQDADPQQPSSFLPMFELQEALAKLRCHHLLIILDCCFSGAFRWQRTRSLSVQLSSTLFMERYQRYLRDPARQVLTSCAHDERALDTIQRRSVFGDRGMVSGGSPFAKALCDGLRGKADLRTANHAPDGVIVPSELYLYIEDVLARMEVQLQRPLQRPMLWSLEGHEKGQFIFWTPGASPQSLQLPAALPIIEENNPYRGLEVYEESHQALFFGRRDATERLTEAVLKQPLLVVVGASGTGKSSLVRAGLLPRLRAPTQPSWVLMSPLRPGPHPRTALQQLAQQLAPGSQDLAQAVHAFRARHPEKKLLLLIDQLEELVTVGKAESPQFLRELAAARAAGGVMLHIVATLRSDFEPHFAELLSAGSGPSPRFLVPHMRREDLRQAIEGPASQRVLFFEPPELVDKLVDEVIDMPGALPLLSFTLSEMYRVYARRHAEGEQSRTLSEADYSALGEVAGALSRRAEEIYKDLDEAAQRTLRYLMLRMVVPGELARRRVYQSELIFPEGEQQRLDSLQQKLLAARLIVSSRDDEGKAYIEPAHDKLVLGWRRLAEFISEEGEVLPLHYRLSLATGEWKRNGQRSSALWDRDARLPQVRNALRWQTSRSIIFTRRPPHREHGWGGGAHPGRRLRPSPR